MLKARKFYHSFKPEDVTGDNLFHHQVQVNKAAKAYAGARKAFSSLKTEFQEMKLYEAFGEAAAFNGTSSADKHRRAAALRGRVEA